MSRYECQSCGACGGKCDRCGLRCCIDNMEKHNEIFKLKDEFSNKIYYAKNNLIDICNEIKKQINSENSVDLIFNVFNFVRKLKEMRMFSVENINQYNFIYKFLEQYLIERNVPPQLNNGN